MKKLIFVAATILSLSNCVQPSDPDANFVRDFKTTLDTGDQSAYENKLTSNAKLFSKIGDIRDERRSLKSSLQILKDYLAAHPIDAAKTVRDDASVAQFAVTKPIQRDVDAFITDIREDPTLLRFYDKDGHPVADVVVWTFSSHVKTSGRDMGPALNEYQSNKYIGDVTVYAEVPAQ